MSPLFKIHPLQKSDIMSHSEDGKCGGRWTLEEHENFLIGLAKYGREWKKIQSLISTRTPAQIRSHAQKHFLKLSKDDQENKMGASNADNLSGSHKRKDMIHVLSAFESTLSFLKLKRTKLERNDFHDSDRDFVDYFNREDELIAAEVLSRMYFECH